MLAGNNGSDERRKGPAPTATRWIATGCVPRLLTVTVTVADEPTRVSGNLTTPPPGSGVAFPDG
jgi:hypothetical protein